MKSLLCSAELLCVLLFIPRFMTQTSDVPKNVTNSTGNLSATSLVTTTPTPLVTTKRIPSTQPTLNTNTPHWPFLKNECRQELVVCGGVIIACAFFLMTTLMLTSKLCQMSRRLRTLRCHNVELTNTSEYCVETSKKDQVKSEAEAKETTLLMDDQTNQVDADANKEDKGKADKDGQKTEEKEAGDAPKGEKASADDAESLLFPKPPEEILGSESAAAAASSSSSEGGKEEPKSEP